MGNSKELSEDGRTIVEFHKLESSLGAIYYQLQIWLTSDHYLELSPLWLNRHPQMI